jgi:hypothetical protein
MQKEMRNRQSRSRFSYEQKAATKKGDVRLRPSTGIKIKVLVDDCIPKSIISECKDKTYSAMCQ